MKNKYKKTYHRHKILRVKDVLTLENCKMAYRLEHKLLPKKLEELYFTNQQEKSLKTHGYNTGWEQLIRSHLSASFCFKLSGNSN